MVFAALAARERSARVLTGCPHGYTLAREEAGAPMKNNNDYGS
jgi:hypothetical protein